MNKLTTTEMKKKDKINKWRYPEFRLLFPQGLSAVILDWQLAQFAMHFIQPVHQLNFIFPKNLSITQGLLEELGPAVTFLLNLKVPHLRAV